MFQPSYLEKELKPYLKKLEEERLVVAKKVDTRTKAVLITSLLVFAVFISYKVYLWPEGFPLVFLFIPIIIAAVFLLIGGLLARFFLTKELKKNYEKTIKAKIYEKALRNYNTSVEYFPEQHIEEATFKKAALFGSFNRFGGDDLCVGKMEDGRAFRFSELKVYRTSRSNSSVGKSSKTVTIFEGLFYELELSQYFEAQVKIVSYKKEAFGAVGKFMQGMIQKALTAFAIEAPLVKFEEEYPDFDQSFKVYSKQEQVARQLITPDFIEKIRALELELGGEVYLSFEENYCHVGVRRGDFLDVNLKSSLLSPLFLDQLEENLDDCFSNLKQLEQFTSPEKGFVTEKEDNKKMEIKEDTKPPKNPFTKDKPSVSYKKSNSKDNPFLL